MVADVIYGFMVESDAGTSKAGDQHCLFRGQPPPIPPTKETDYHFISSGGRKVIQGPRPLPILPIATVALAMFVLLDG